MRMMLETIAAIIAWIVVRAIVWVAGWMFILMVILPFVIRQLIHW